MSCTTPKAGDHRYWAIEANNRAWELVESASLPPELKRDLIAIAWSAYWHWEEHLQSLAAPQRAAAPNRLRALHLLCCAVARHDLPLRTGATTLRSGATAVPSLGELAESAAAEQARLMTVAPAALTRLDLAMTSLCAVLSGDEGADGFKDQLAGLDGDERTLVQTLLDRCGARR